MPTVTLPDNSTVEFPAGTTPDVMDSAIRQHLGQPQSKPLVIGPSNNDANPRGDSSQAEMYSAPPPSGSTGEGNPLVGDTLAKSAPFTANLEASLAPNVGDQIKHFSKAMGIPENRFGVIDGHIVYADENGSYQRVTPSVFGGKSLGEDFLRLGRYVGSGTGGVIPQVAGTVAGGVVGPTELSIPVAGAVAAGTDVLRQGASNLLLGRRFTDGIDYTNAAGQGVQAAAGQGIGVGASRALESRGSLSALDARKATAPGFRADVSDITDEANRRGIDLTRGQATGLNSDLQAERMLGRFPETSDLMRERIELQRGTQVPNAVQSEISSISPQGGATAINSFRQGAEDVATQATDSRRLAANQDYAAAFKANPSISSPVIDRILRTPAGREALKGAAVKMQNAMSIVGTPDAELTAAAKEAADLGKMNPMKGGVASGLKLRTLDYVKQSLDDQASAAARSGNMGDAKIIGDLKRKLVSELDRLDVTAAAGPNSLKPEGGLYAQARARFGNASDAIDAIVNGGVGFVNKMGGMDRQAIVNRAFSQANILPEEMTKMRNAFVSAGKTDEFNAGLSSFLSDRLDEAMKVGATGKLGNVPGKFYASVWGDPRQQKVMEAAFGDPARAAGFGKFMEVLRRASTSLAESSPTATDLPGMAPNKPGTALSVMGKVLSPASWLHLGTDAVNAMAAARTPAYRLNLAKQMLGGNFDKQLAQLRMLSPTSERAVTIVGSILSNAGMGGAKSASGLTTPRDRLPASTAPYPAATP